MELNREHFSAIIFYNFRCGLTQQQCINELNSTFGDETPSRPSVYRWYGEFNRGRSSLQDEFREGRPKSVVVLKNIDAVRKLILQIVM
jgi:histone-lysine N-methyltransferase SETMAR